MHEPGWLILSGCCVMAAGVLFLGYPDGRRRWIGFLLVSAGAGHLASMSRAWTIAMVVCWVIFLMILILYLFFEDPKGR